MPPRVPAGSGSATYRQTRPLWTCTCIRPAIPVPRSWSPASPTEWYRPISPLAPETTASRCGAPGDIVTKASSGSVSSYAAIPPGTWTMSATGPSAEANLPVTLADSTVHTEVVIDGSSGLEIINLVDAAGTGQPPTGGANTGFGGTAAHGPGSPLPWIAVIGAGLLLALTGGIRLRRS